MKIQRIALYLRAPNDRSGNPRRGWAVFRLGRRAATFERFIEEGYHGRRELEKHYPDPLPEITVSVAPREWAEWSKLGSQ